MPMIVMKDNEKKEACCCKTRTPAPTALHIQGEHPPQHEALVCGSTDCIIRGVNILLLAWSKTVEQRLPAGWGGGRGW